MSGFAVPEHFNLMGEAAFQPAKPKRKTRLSVSFFWKQVDGFKNNPLGLHPNPNRSSAQAGPVWGGGATE